MDKGINFPNLHIVLHNVGKTFSVFGFEIAYYGVIIAVAMVIGVYITCHEARRSGQSQESYLDMLTISLILAVIGARLYYVLCNLTYYADHLTQIFNVRKGGLAIYGGILFGFLGILLFARRKKKNPWRILDTCAIGLLIGQVIGRWGNFFNRESFGGYTNGLFAMQLPVSAVRQSEINQGMLDHITVIDQVQYIQVHPAFLYESLWNLCLLAILFWYRDRKKFQGELFLLYLIGYGVGRFWIEGLRTDQLLLPVLQLPFSQIIAALCVIGGLILWIKKRMRLRYKKTRQSSPEGVTE